MNKKFGLIFVVLVGLATIIAGFTLIYQQSVFQTLQGKFGIYLLKNNELVISDEDIVWYDRNIYEIKLTDEGFKKIQELKVSVYGEPFIIKINDEEIYNGSFWTPISSVSYHGIAIVTFVNTTNSTIKLEKGYPSSDFFEGVDPRNDSRILDHFQKIGKLKQTFKIKIDYNPPN